MNLKQTVYFMTLVGAVAGLCCWFLQATIGDFAVGVGQAQQNLIGATLMGALIGGLTVGFADHWSSDRVVVKWVVAGTVLGALAGIVGGLLFLPILSGLNAARPAARPDARPPARLADRRRADWFDHRPALVQRQQAARRARAVRRPGRRHAR